MSVSPDTIPTTGSEILDETRAFIARFATLPSEAALDAVTLWICHSHVVDADERLSFETTPRLALLSSGPASGKTRVLDLIGLLGHNAQSVVDPTPASFALMVSEKKATVLIDELDILFGAGGAKATLRSQLNAGYKVGAVWSRANKADVSIFSAVAMAGLGQKFRSAEVLSPLRSRCIQIHMAPGKVPESYRARWHAPTGNALRAGLAAWCKRHRRAILAAFPDEFDGITDRNMEIAEPLIMIADIAGGRWPAAARAAIRELLLGVDDLPDGPSLTGQLLADLRIVFGTADKMSTADIVDELRSLPFSGWLALWPSVDNAPRELAALLGGVGVSPARVRFGVHQVRGYLAADLAPHWHWDCDTVTACDATADVTDAVA